MSPGSPLGETILAKLLRRMLRSRNALLNLFHAVPGR